MPSFLETLNPTCFSFFDEDADFQSDADKILNFVKIRLGDNIMKVELTNKMVWSCFEEACLEYSAQIAEFQIKSDLVNMLGMPTSSAEVNNTYFKQTLNFLMRQAEPYSSYAGAGGSWNAHMGYIDLVAGRQDYNVYTEAYSVASGSLLSDMMPSGSKGKIQVTEVFHFSPLAAHHYLLNSSNITNFLASEFNYESYVNSTVFYVLPIFEDVLRRGMMDAAMRVRRSNYSYELIGTNLRIFPAPSVRTIMEAKKLFLRVTFPTLNGPTDSAYPDDTINGVSGPHNAPIGILPYSTVNQWGRQWIRNYTLALSKITLGRVRSKLREIPIPGQSVTLDGEMLVNEGKEEKNDLVLKIKEFLNEITFDKLQEQQTTRAENLIRHLRTIPMPNGRGIILG